MNSSFDSKPTMNSGSDLGLTRSATKAERALLAAKTSLESARAAMRAVPGETNFSISAEVGSVRSVLEVARAKIGVQHPDFGLGAPPPPGGIRPVPNFGMWRKMSSDLQRFRNMPRDSSLTNIPTYHAQLAKLAQFSYLFDEADMLGQVPTITAMGIQKPRHSDLDEGAPLRVDRVHTWDQSVLRSVVTDWRGAFSNVASDRVKLVLPTKTNLGWPFLFSDKDERRKFMLATLAMMVQTEKAKGSSLSDLLSSFRGVFHAPFLALGTRNQHTGKAIPIVDAAGRSWTQNFEPRVRSIFMGSKMAIIWNRERTKKLLKAAMGLKQHDQDRKYIKATIEKWKADPSTDVVAIDVSKFDKGHGGNVLGLFAKAMESVTGDRSIAADFLAEVSMPLLVTYGSSAYLTEDKIAPQLPSGVSFTTVAGLFFGDYISRFIAVKAGAHLRDRGRTWDYLNWGDDMVINIPKQLNLAQKLPQIGKDLGLALEEEPTLKYLGFNYGSGEFQAREGYSVARLVIKTFFPEREKSYPFSVIGYIARLNFIPDPAKFHDTFLKVAWDETIYGPRFAFNEKDEALAVALRASEDAEVFDQDALNFLLHGLDPDEGQDLLTAGGIDFDVSAWVGGSYTNFEDAMGVIREETAFDATPYMRQLKAIETVGANALPELISKFATNEGLRTDGGLIW